jgi:hypothetical protein
MKFVVRLFSRASAKLIWLSGGLLLGVLWGCFLDKTAGTSSGAENPELVVSFSEGGGPIAVTGNLELYESTQNPVLSPDPVFSVSLDNSSRVVIPSHMLEVIGNGDSTLARVSAKTAPRHFNLVLRADRYGGILQGFSYDKTNKIILKENKTVDSEVPFPLKTLFNSSWKVAGAQTSGAVVFLFIPGSPYKALVKDSLFEIKYLPEGNYAGRLLTDSGWVYTLKNSLQTGTDQTAIPDKVEKQVDADAVNLLLPKDTVPRMTSSNRYFVIEDTVMSSILISDICEAANHSGAMVRVLDSIQISLRDTDSAAAREWKYIPWSELDESEILRSKKITFYSIQYDSGWEGTHEIKLRDEWRNCAATKAPNTDMHLDSLYLFYMDTWKLKRILYFPLRKIDTLLVKAVPAGPGAHPDTIMLRRVPPDPQQSNPPDSLVIRQWNLGDSAWSDTLWIN